MKKARLFARIGTAVLVVLMIVGVIILITDESNAQTTTYELIAFVVGIVGMLMAIVSQVYTVKQDREFDRMERNIREILETEQADLKTAQRILDEIKPSKRR